WAVGFCASCLASTELASLLSPLSRVRGGGCPIVRVPEARRATLIERFATLQSSLQGDAVDDTATIVQRSWLALLLAEVKAIDALATPPTTPRPSIVADALAYIEQHCLEAITLADIAAAVSRTPSYVTSVLTRSTGKSAGAWITAGRMAEARRRLLHTDERIDIVAERVGYADVAHFTRMFSRTHGLPPGAWRARHRAS
ncbi:MAG TPA: AraC family transcriptional regulator, partial [Myxococcota bacterium]